MFPVVGSSSVCTVVLRFVQDELLIAFDGTFKLSYSDGLIDSVGFQDVSWSVEVLCVIT